MGRRRRKYGRPVSEWFGIVRSSPLAGRVEFVAWLKAEYGLGHGHARGGRPGRGRPVGGQANWPGT
ncbi:DUF4287 domain-containing protein [Streptomyces sp. NPDC088090]|uniref:DUF4287 domain-containing protein n=1 Tax=Streptomyces sp. NPDC088090 TaxID=3365822 RepID=UPI00384EBE1A